MEARVWAKEMALYNKWQNETVFGLCAAMETADYMADRGMFFGSIHNTLDHMYLVETRLMDYMEKGAPEGPFEPKNRVWPDFQSLHQAREAFDRLLLALPETKPSDWLSEPVPLTSEGFGPGRAFPRQYLMMQLFNHGTHHRAQVTSELHRMGLAYGNTDIPFNPHSQF